MKRLLAVGLLTAACVVPITGNSGAAALPADRGTAACPDAMTAATEEVCLVAASWRSSADRRTVGKGSQDSLELAINALEQAAAEGNAAAADAFLTAARGDYTEAQIASMQSALDDPGMTDTPQVGDATTSERTGRGVLQERQQRGDGVGSPKYETWWIDYNVLRSDGSVRVISTTRADFGQAIAINSSSWGRKTLDVSLTKSAGANTYYSDVDCEIRRVDLWSDSTVYSWPCRSPNYHQVNDYDMWVRVGDYYGNRGGKYYNEFWFDINPEGSTYDTIRANREGSKWKNPDGGGRPFWL